MTAHKIHMSKSLISALFFDMQKSREILNQQITTVIVLLSIAGDLIKNSESLEKTSAEIDEVVSHLSDKINRLSVDQCWNVIQGISYTDVLNSYHGLERLGFKFLEPAEMRNYKKDTTLINFSGDNLRENDEQKRVLSKIRDIENIHKMNVNGIAGSGKTTLLYNATDMLSKLMPRANIIWLSGSIKLTQTINSKYAGNDNITGSTFYHFCENLIIPEVKWGKKFLLPLNDDVIINQLDLAGNTASQRFDFKLIAETVNNYCQVSDFAFKDNQVPRYCKDTKKQIILEYARQYWRLIINTKEKNIPVQRHHHLKYVQNHIKDVQGFNVDLLLVDEAQDLPPSMLYIIKCLSGQYKSCEHNNNTRSILFGDKFQSIKYKNEWSYDYDTKKKVYNPKHTVKMDKLTDSERLGHSANGLISNVLTSGGYGQDESEFFGINPKETEIHHCSWSDLESGIGIRENKTLFLVEDVWSALFAAQVLSQKNVPIYILEDTIEEMKAIILSAFAFIDNGLITHSEFTGYKDWETYVAIKSKDNFLMERINDMIHKGYRQEHLETTLEKAKPSNKKHLISLMKHSKGMECEQIYVLPNNRKQQMLNGVSGFSTQESNELYTALTRSTHKIFLPAL